jgi:parallel beta-helix repeat protein
VKSVENDRLTLAAPLKFPVPAMTLIRDADAANLIELRGTCEDVIIRNLTLDGGRKADDPPVRGHAQLCGVFAAGPYDYAKGPTGPKLRGIAVEDCIIQNCHGRGVALYSVENFRIERCTFMDTGDEAVDLDHFTMNGEVRGNRITRCRVAFELNDASRCLITGNEVSECGTGVNLWRWCKQDDLNEGNRILDNAFTGTAGNAVQLGKETRGNTVSDNDITGCGKNGIVVLGEQQVVQDNRISGVKLKAVAE